MSLRGRIHLMIGSTMFLMIGVGVVFVIFTARHSVANEISSTVNLTRRLLDAGEDGVTGHGVPSWLSHVATLAKTRHLRIVAPDDQPGKESSRDLTGFEAPRWFVWAVTPKPIEIRKRLVDSDGVSRELVIRSDPDDEIAEAWGEARTFFVLIVLLALAVYGLVHITLTRAFRAVSEILKGLEKLEEGDYAERLPRFSTPEFTRIGEAFNQAAEGLEKARRENRALKNRALEIQEEERRNLAREIHDELGQSLTAIKVMAVSLKNAVGDEPAAVRSIIATCDHLFTVVRAMIRRLHPISLEELGLKASLEDLLSNWQACNPAIDIDFACDDLVESCCTKTKTHLFRVIQECLTNVFKHANARRVRVFIGIGDPGMRQNEAVLVEVADDGCGYDPSTATAGFGLGGIQERAESMGGTLHVDTQPGRGVTVTMSVPLDGMK